MHRCQSSNFPYSEACVIYSESFALTVSAYFSPRSARVPEDYQNAIVHLTLLRLWLC